MTTHLAEDRRLYARVRSSDPVQARSMIDADREWRLLSLDLSESGMQLLSPEPLAVGARLLCEIDGDPASEPIRVIGRVARVEEIDFHARYNIGVEFVEVSDAVRKRLRRLVEARAAEREVAAREELRAGPTR